MVPLRPTPFPSFISHIVVPGSCWKADSLFKPFHGWKSIGWADTRKPMPRAPTQLLLASLALPESSLPNYALLQACHITSHLWAAGHADSSTWNPCPGLTQITLSDFCVSAWHHLLPKVPPDCPSPSSERVRCPPSGLRQHSASTPFHHTRWPANSYLTC